MIVKLQDTHDIYSLYLQDDERSIIWTIDIAKSAPASVFFDAVRELERGYIEGSRGSNGEV